MSRTELTLLLACILSLTGLGIAGVLDADLVQAIAEAEAGYVAVALGIARIRNGRRRPSDEPPTGPVDNTGPRM